MIWSFGINKNIPVINLATENYNGVFYASSNVGVIYDHIENKQLLLQGHVSIDVFSLTLVILNSGLSPQITDFYRVHQKSKHLGKILYL